MKKIILISSIALFAISISFGQEFRKLDASPLDVSYYPANATKGVFAKTASEKDSLEPKVRIL